MFSLLISLQSLSEYCIQWLVLSGLETVENDCELSLLCDLSKGGAIYNGVLQNTLCVMYIVMTPSI